MLKMYFDGAYEISTGIMGLGCIVELDGENIYSHSEKVYPGGTVKLGDHTFEIGETSNNVSEYLSLIAGLVFIKQFGYDKIEGIIYGDSKLVIEQMSGRWGIKEGAYKPYAAMAKKLSWHINSKFKWLPREQNTRCDSLSREKL